jgi:uncharacterized membrane protein
MSPSSDTSPDQAGERTALPFEPKKRKSTEKKTPPPVPAKAAQRRSQPALAQPEATKDVAGKTVKPPAQPDPDATAIPEVVSQRMVRRMLVFCGVPSALGMLTFLMSYFLVTRQLFEVPTSAVVLVSMGFFGLGVLGLSYGVLSASWDEETPGSTIGWAEFTTNFGRMTEAWRSPKN